MTTITAFIHQSGQLEHLASEFAARLSKRVQMRLRQALSRLSGGYHPERYYMRGPGPRWHAKHDPVAGGHDGPSLAG